VQRLTPYNTNDGICIDDCKPCDYSSQLLTYVTCDYILMNGERRPCKAGNGCTVRTINGELKPLPYIQRESAVSTPKQQQPISRNDYLHFQSVYLMEWRIKHKFTQEQAATKLGVSRRTYGDWENGRFIANTKILKRHRIDIVKEFENYDN